MEPARPGSSRPCSTSRYHRLWCCARARSALAPLRAVVPDLLLGPGVVADEARRHAPGQDAIHYAPRARLVLGSRDQAIAAALAHGGPCGLVLRGEPPLLPPTVTAIVLPDDAALYARGLYRVLHELDDAGVELIAVESPPDDEAWMAVVDRLRRAAAK